MAPTNMVRKFLPPFLICIAQKLGDNDSFVEEKKCGKDLEAQEDDRMSYMDEELQFILENFEFAPEFADEVSYSLIII